jgi:hypothetical protein
MKIRTLISAAVLFLTIAGFSLVPAVNPEGIAAGGIELYEDPEICTGCSYQYVYIDSVRWIYIYGPDGSLLSAYPDPE